MATDAVNQLEHALATIEKDYRSLIVAYQNKWRSEDDRTEARTTLATSVQNARHVIQDLKSAKDPGLQQRLRKLIVQAELADDSLKHPTAWLR